jgi:hypothetical protein
MSLPNKITGAGNRDAKNVLKITFSTAVATPPVLEAWDNHQTYPSVDTVGETAEWELFTGTTGNGLKPMLYAKDTTAESSGVDWKPTSAVAGGDSPNRLKGTDNYMTFLTIPSGECKFNLGAEIPSDATVPSNMNFLLQVRYRYSGSAPSVKFLGNTGTEASPVWEEIAPNSRGLQFADLNTDWSGTPTLSLPESGLIDAPELGAL